MDASFNEAYYATLAQVIPVFGLVMIASFFWKIDPSVNPSVRGLLNLACLGFVVFGEMLALDTLKAGETPTSLQDSLMNFAVVVPLLRIAFPLGHQAASEAFAKTHIHRRRKLGAIVGLFLVAASVAYFVSGKSNEVLSWFVVGALVTMVVWAAILEVDSSRKP